MFVMVYAAYRLDVHVMGLGFFCSRLIGCCLDRFYERSLSLLMCLLWKNWNFLIMFLLPKYMYYVKIYLGGIAKLLVCLISTKKKVLAVLIFFVCLCVWFGLVWFFLSFCCFRQNPLILWTSEFPQVQILLGFRIPIVQN